jgi:hypothetical protein
MVFKNKFHLGKSSISCIWEGKQQPSSCVKKTRRKATLGGVMNGEKWWGGTLLQFFLYLRIYFGYRVEEGQLKI